MHKYIIEKSYVNIMLTSAVMNNFQVALKSIISKASCSLCLEADTNNDKLYNLNDEIYLQQNIIQVSDLLLSVLGTEILESCISSLICDKCLTSAINNYNFMEMCKSNYKHIKNIVNSFCYTVINAEKPKQVDSSFIHVDPNNYECNIFFQNKDIDIQPIELDVMLTNKNKLKPKKKFKIVKKDFKCKLCLKFFPQSQNLRAHFLRVHAPKTFKCNKCPKMFGANMLLEQHKLGSHTAAVCSECGKLFNNRHSLRLHEKSHGLQLVCPDCGRIYKREVTYKKHIQSNICSQTSRKSQNEAIYCCDTCGKKYCLKSTLRVHIQFEHGNGKAFVCKWCSKKFSAQSLLNAHTVKHTQEKKFVCNYCTGKFVSKESLLYHIRRHTGEKPYKCEKCDCKFVSTSRRSEHVKKVHNQGQMCRKCFQKYTPNT